MSLTLSQLRDLWVHVRHTRRVLNRVLSRRGRVWLSEFDRQTRKAVTIETINMGIDNAKKLVTKLEQDGYW